MSNLRELEQSIATKRTSVLRGEADAATVRAFEYELRLLERLHAEQRQAQAAQEATLHAANATDLTTKLAALADGAKPTAVREKLAPVAQQELSKVYPVEEKR